MVLVGDALDAAGVAGLVVKVSLAGSPGFAGAVVSGTVIEVVTPAGGVGAQITVAASVELGLPASVGVAVVGSDGVGVGSGVVDVHDTLVGVGVGASSATARPEHTSTASTVTTVRAADQRHGTAVM